MSRDKDDAGSQITRGGVLLGILGGDVQPGPQNPDSFQTKSRHFLHAYSDLASKIHTSFQTLPRRNYACHNYLD